MASRRSEPSGGLAMLDVIVLIAMAVTAAAVAVGLVLHSGIAQIPALIAAAALYMVMAASYLMVARASRPTAASDRLNELEEALEVIDKDLQRIDRVEDDVSRLDLLADRVERLDQAMSDYGASERPGGSGRFDQFSQEFEEVHAKIDNVRADLEGEAKNQREKITGDLRILEGLIKQLSHELRAAAAAEPAVAAYAGAAPAAARAQDILADIVKMEPDEEPDEPTEIETLTILEVEEEVALEEVEEEKEEVAVEEEVVALVEDVPPQEDFVEAAEAAHIDDREMLEIVSQAIEAGRVDLYLQPTVTLPERKPR